MTTAIPDPPPLLQPPAETRLDAPLTCGDGDLIVAIEYHRENNGVLLPNAVFTSRPPGGKGYSVHDFTWCQRDEQLYHHESGGGGGRGFYVNALAHRGGGLLPGAVWWDRERTFPYDASMAKRRLDEAALHKQGFEVLTQPLLLAWYGSRVTVNPFDVGVEDHVEWCSRCKDFLPWEQFCEHIFECETCGHVSAPGDRCGHRRH